MSCLGHDKYRVGGPAGTRCHSQLKANPANGGNRRKKLPARWPRPTQIAFLALPHCYPSLAHSLNLSNWDHRRQCSPFSPETSPSLFAQPYSPTAPQSRTVHQSTADLTILCQVLPHNRAHSAQQSCLQCARNRSERGLGAGGGQSGDYDLHPAAAASHDLRTGPKV